VAKLKEAYPEAEVQLWAEDEMRLGLKPVIRRGWAPKGKRPTAKTKRRYEWLYVYGFVRPKTGEVYWLILPKVNVEVFSMALKHFAQEVGASKDRRILLVLDQAGWHTGKEVEVPEGIHLEFLPSHSPELQPTERLWPLTNEAVANRLFESLDELEEALIERCVALCEQTETIRSRTNYHWWPDAA
jgi:transposase